AGYKVSATGLCVPGVVSGQTVRIAPNLGWSNVNPIEQLDLSAAGGNERAVLVNDVNAGLIGELTVYQGIPPITLAYFCGTGVGGAVALNGELITGAQGGAGEVGHMVVRQGKRKPASGGIRGSLEAYIGKWSLNNKIQNALADGVKTELKSIIDYDLERTPIKSSSIKKAYNRGDDFTRQLMNEYYARYLGAAISQSANLLEPHLVILGGGIMEALGGKLLPHIKSHMEKHCMVEPPELRLAELADLAGPTGAAHLAAKK
ncbi:MAG: ROK family protein, partial [Leptospiraceae bacterium]|nr:ROK family protein [Leptospiraceae bacterium]